MTSRYVKKQYPQFKVPGYFHSNDYVRTGNFVVRMPNEAYYEKFPDNDQEVFIHHGIQVYLYLTEKLP